MAQRAFNEAGSGALLMRDILDYTIIDCIFVFCYLFLWPISVYIWFKKKKWYSPYEIPGWLYKGSETGSWE